MAKKAIKIYLSEEDASWANEYPVHDTVGGTASFYVDWAFKQVRRGQVSALQKLSIDEKNTVIIITYLNLRKIAPDFSPAMLAATVEDWFNYDKGATWGCSDETIAHIVKICRDMTPSEVIGLLSWAKSECLKIDSEALAILVREGEGKGK